MNESKIVAFCGQSILRYLKRELMEIIEVYVADDKSQRAVKSLVNQKLHNAYKKIKNESLDLIKDSSNPKGDSSKFLEELEYLETIYKSGKCK